jgi:hypothetical protein
MDPSQLLKMSQEQLDELFKQSPPGDIPEGAGAGAPIIFPGSWLAKFFAWLTRWFLWQGKTFDARDGSLRNRITAFSLPAIKAKVYKAPSWLDEKEAIVLDYSRTSLLAHWIRDEIREVAPGLYLGKVWWGRRRLIDFIVSFQYQPAGKFWRRLISAVCLAVLIMGVWLAARLGSDRAVAYESIEDHFKYGSTGGERGSGIPYSIFKLLPRVFSDHIRGPAGYDSFGLIYEKDKDGNLKDLPIGFSKRNVMGVDRVFVNCAVCHVGSVRDTPESAPRIVVGMPSNTVDLQGFQRFLIDCVRDERFTARRLMPEIARDGAEDWINRLGLRLIGVNLMRERLLTLGDRFKFLDEEPDCGPGRFDTFNPPKALLNFPMDKLSPEEKIGLCDFPSIWNQGQRKERNMQLHWDGNNVSVQERNRSAAFGTGATPPTLDRESIKRIEDWLLTAKPPPYPYPINQTLAARGAPLYAQYCASCHGRSGEDFSGEYVGQVTPIEKIKTDRWRLDSYTFELCVNQNLLYAGYGDERFSHFRKTFGYANQPLDGVWLRAPYLHNGSAPTLRDLLESAEHRPKEFYRGYDVFDPQRVGFVSNLPDERGRKFFRYDTTLRGNGNYGHEGPEYGTHLSPEEKDAIVEYLKRF